MAQYDVDLREYWQIIRKRKTYILLLVLIVAICSYGFAKFKEPVPLYEAVAAIKIDRSANIGSILTGAYWNQAENMVTHAYIIKSFPVLAKAAQITGKIPSDVSLDNIRSDKEYLSIVQQLKDIVEAEHQEGTNIIDIAVVSRDPLEAASLANGFASAYRDYNIAEKNKKLYDTKTFIEQQLRLTSDKLKAAERELQSFKEGYALISMDAQTQNTLDKLYSIENEYEKVKTEKSEVSSQLSLLENSKKGLIQRSKEVFFSTDKDSPLFTYKEKLSELFIKRQTLLHNFTARHPSVREVDDQIIAIIYEAKKELQSLLNALQNKEADYSERLAQLREENKRLPEKALQLVRLQREVDLQASLYSQLKEKYQETLIQESNKVEEVSIVKPAVPPDKPSNMPSKLIIVGTGLVMGLIVGIVFAFMAEIFDTSMGRIEDVEEVLQVPVLGVIPFLEGEVVNKSRSKHREPQRTRTRDLVTHYKPGSMGSEAFRALRTNLQFLRPETKGKVFLITSAFVQEGKTVNAINLALIMAQAGNKVLLVDADLRKPLVNKYYGLPISPGLTDHVLGNYHWKEVTNTISDIMLGDFGIDDILITPGMDTLHILTAGTKPPNPSEILTSNRFREFLKEAAKNYDFIFIDAPPVMPVADASDIATLADGVILVYMTGKIGRGVLRRVKSNLENVDAKLTGVILNKIKSDAGPEYYQYHSYYYYGSEPQVKKGKKVKRRKKVKKSKIASKKLDRPNPKSKIFGSVAR
ncbi:MAG: polysaccharide biosynthesis tyrosine autokinase [Deltaproteobacteria bacterium]|jgi:succinoglycan biosynthesis transport protein ExoP